MQLADAVPILDQLIGVFLTQGLLGAVCVALAFALYRKDAALTQLSKDRVDDIKKFGDVIVKNSETNALLVASVNGMVTLFQNSKLVR